MLPELKVGYASPLGKKPGVRGSRIVLMLSFVDPKETVASSRGGCAPFSSGGYFNLESIRLLACFVQ
jgi:hypothetical protein